MTDTPDRRILQLSPADNVAVATRTLEAGDVVMIAGRTLTLTACIPTGHKLALAAIAAGQQVLKYGAPIGRATCEIAAGEHVHLHNVRSDYLPTRRRGEE